MTRRRVPVWDLVMTVDEESPAAPAGAHVVKVLVGARVAVHAVKAVAAVRADPLKALDRSRCACSPLMPTC